MDGATDGSMLPEAEAATRESRATPPRSGPWPPRWSSARARPRQPEAHVVALHAHAWAEHEALRNEAARELLDRALRVAAPAGPGPPVRGACSSAAPR